MSNWKDGESATEMFHTIYILEPFGHMDDKASIYEKYPCREVLTVFMNINMK